jgi:putative ATP-dependent DNA ligase
MDDKTPAERRKLKDLVNAARQEGRARDERLGHWSYRRFTHNYQSIPAGKIGRMFHLGQGLDANFACPFWVEEKVDGYNVRIFAHENEVLAVTRRGYICPFTTDRIKDFININLFTVYPNLIVCAEVAGPENPYNTAGPSTFRRISGFLYLI